MFVFIEFIFVCFLFLGGIIFLVVAFLYIWITDVLAQKKQQKLTSEYDDFALRAKAYLEKLGSLDVEIKSYLRPECEAITRFMALINQATESDGDAGKDYVEKIQKLQAEMAKYKAGREECETRLEQLLRERPVAPVSSNPKINRAITAIDLGPTTLRDFKNKFGITLALAQAYASGDPEFAELKRKAADVKPTKESYLYDEDELDEETDAYLESLAWDDEEDEEDLFDEYAERSSSSSRSSSSRRSSGGSAGSRSIFGQWQDDYNRGYADGRADAVQGDRYRYISGVEGSDAYKNGYTRGFEQNEHCS